MECRDGWATEYGRQKYDVTVQEQDLPLVFAEYGIPAEYIGRLTLNEKWAIMTRYAHMYAATEAVRLASADQQMAATALASVEAQNVARVLGGFMARVGLINAEANHDPESEPYPYPSQERSDDSAAGLAPAIAAG